MRGTLDLGVCLSHLFVLMSGIYFPVKCLHISLKEDNKEIEFLCEEVNFLLVYLFCNTSVASNLFYSKI